MSDLRRGWAEQRGPLPPTSEWARRAVEDAGGWPLDDADGGEDSGD